MKTFHFSLDNDIKHAADIIKNHGIVCYPTETLYGLGVLFDSEVALQKLIEIKRRDKKKPISVLVDSRDMLDEIVAEVNDTAQMLIEKFWPGPLTLIFTISPKLPENIRMILTAETDSIGVRISSCKLSQALVHAVGKPITTTSANISGDNNLFNVSEIQKFLAVDYILPAQAPFLKMHSTIIDVRKNKPLIIREGAISRKALLEHAEI